MRRQLLNSMTDAITFYGGNDTNARLHDFYQGGTKTTYADMQGKKASDIRKEDWLVVNTSDGDDCTFGNNNSTIPVVVDVNTPAGKTYPDFFSGGTKSVHTDKEGNRATGLRPGEWDL